MNLNHDFAPPEQRHLLHSMRNISVTKGGIIKSMVNAGMRVTNIWSYSGEEVGGFDKLGIMIKKICRIMSTKKLKWIEAEDAQSLMNHLQSRQAQDPMFYYSVAARPRITFHQCLLER